MRLNDPGPPDDQSNDESSTVVRGQDHSDDDWSDSDEDGEENQDGYRVLPQEAPAETEEQQDLESPNVEDTFEEQLNPIYEEESRRSFAVQEALESAEVFTSTSRQSSIDLNNEKLSTIQGVMSKIVLPPSAVPEWAGKITDDEWKAMLEQKLGIKSASDQKQQSGANTS